MMHASLLRFSLTLSATLLLIAGTLPRRIVHSQMTALSVKRVVIGLQHTCAITTNDGLLCWGANSFGQLGIGNTSGSTVPVQVSGMSSGVSDVALGQNHTCAIANGLVKCWGSNIRSQLGTQATGNLSLPTLTRAIPYAIQNLSAGWLHTCALGNGDGVSYSDNVIICWGASTVNGGTADTSTPTVVVGNRLIYGLHTGSYHTCYTERYLMQCWGRNGTSQLGDGTQIDSASPVMARGTGASDSVALGFGHTCAVDYEPGGLGIYTRCWGQNDHGQLGNGQIASFSRVAVAPQTSAKLVRVYAGGAHTCGITETGEALCWGRNERGQLGDGTTTSSATPVNVLGIPEQIESMSSRDQTTCAVTVSGALYCWGGNEAGQLGVGDTTARSRPVRVALPEPATPTPTPTTPTPTTPIPTTPVPTTPVPKTPVPTTPIPTTPVPKTPVPTTPIPTTPVPTTPVPTTPVPTTPIPPGVTIAPPGSHRQYLAQISRQLVEVPPPQVFNETEPNDTRANASGPLRSNIAFSADANNGAIAFDNNGQRVTSDFFFLVASSPGNVAISITGSNLVGQIQVFQDTSTNAIKLDNTPEDGLSVSFFAPRAGRYYVYFSIQPSIASQAPYQVLASFPE
jgi:alpha-tubulin suppressor-like RCC1 family protein